MCAKTNHEPHHEAKESDYKDTLFLPKTSFPMRGNLSKSELNILDYWDSIRLYDRVLESSLSKKKFYLLHDGPPYANGPVHIGSAFNKILKDIVNKTHFMAGYGVNYVPGWDCHGLPIEWRVEQDLVSNKYSKDSITPLDFRKKCRIFAEKNLDKQRESFKRLGVIGRFFNPYITMDYSVEASIADQIWVLAKKGYIYHGVLPVYWSIEEKTVLAEAEIEYQIKDSPSLWVSFDIIWDRPYQASFVVWTTTPWTLPGNRALAVSKDLNYVIYRVLESSLDCIPKWRVLIFAKDCMDRILAQFKIEKGEVLETISGEQLLAFQVHHPLKIGKYDFTVPILDAPFVDSTVGSGVVHVAPAHGHDDFQLSKKYDLEVKQLLSDDGYFLDDIAEFAGKPIFDNKWHMGEGQLAVIQWLKQVQSFLTLETFTHSYPHSWRSHRPLVIRTLKQWFVGLDNNKELRKHALESLKSIQFYPHTGYNRLKSMIENRGDWCISRQRVWGVPIPLFVHKKTGEILLDTKVKQRITDYFQRHSSDCWFDYEPSKFLGDDYNPQDYDQVMDVVDVWFESGCTHIFVLNDPKHHLIPKADLYLEGSDQHRGWFQSSILERLASIGNVPMKTIITHGFVLDKKGYKMSKSLGNVIAPETIAKQHGAEMIRLWTAISEYMDDVRIGDEVIDGCSHMYRRIRNVLKWMLGILHDDQEIPLLPYNQMEGLEQYILDRLFSIQQQAIHAYLNFDFSQAWRLIFDFCNQDLSSFYFDIRKDSLYCDPIFYTRRKSALVTMDILFNTLVRLLAPILSFTSEEAYRIRYPNKKSIHLEQFYDLDPCFVNEAVRKDFNVILRVRKVVLGALEEARQEGYIGSSLEAQACVSVPRDVEKIIEKYPMEDFCITSAFSIIPFNKQIKFFSLPDTEDIYVKIEKAPGKKSLRSWKYSLDVGENSSYPHLAKRDIEAVEAMQKLSF